MACEFSIFKRLQNREDGSNFDDSWTKSIAAVRSSSSEIFLALDNFFVRRATEPTDERTSERTSDRAKQTEHREMDPNYAYQLGTLNTRTTGMFIRALRIRSEFMLQDRLL